MQSIRRSVAISGSEVQWRPQWICCIQQGSPERLGADGGVRRNRGAVPVRGRSQTCLGWPFVQPHIERDFMDLPKTLVFLDVGYAKTLCNLLTRGVSGVGSEHVAVYVYIVWQEVSGSFSGSAVWSQCRNESLDRPKLDCHLQKRGALSDQRSNLSVYCIVPQIISPFKQWYQR